jgi:prevent-host-death family protein
VYREKYTGRSMERIIPISELQSQAKRIVESVKLTHDAVIITQRGRPAALLVNYEEYEGLVATLEEMSQPDWRERLMEAERDSKAGKGIELVEFKARRIKGGKRGRCSKSRSGLDSKSASDPQYSRTPRGWV